MPAPSDHTRRDAEHAARSMIRIELFAYARRMDKEAYAEIAQAIEEATQRGEAIDGIALGKAAADHSIRTYIGAAGPQPAIESSAAEEAADSPE
jgi:hypothetical protein